MNGVVRVKALVRFAWIQSQAKENEGTGFGEDNKKGTLFS